VEISLEIKNRKKLEEYSQNVDKTKHIKKMSTSKEVQ